MDESKYILCVDYGLTKVGVAAGSLPPTTPLEVIHYRQESQLLSHLQELVVAEGAEGIVIGWPADHLTISTPQTEKIRQFGERLGEVTGLPVVYYPETLTTKLATRRMIEVGVSKRRRREVEDSYAAAAILDSYLQEL